MLDEEIQNAFCFSMKLNCELTNRRALSVEFIFEHLLPMMEEFGNVGLCVELAKLLVARSFKPSLKRILDLPNSALRSALLSRVRWFGAAKEKEFYSVNHASKRNPWSKQGSSDVVHEAVFSNSFAGNSQLLSLFSREKNLRGLCHDTVKVY